MVKVTDSSSIKNGETANSSCWIFTNNHIGTHIDTPYHFSETGKQIMDFDPDFWIYNRVLCIDIPCVEARLIDASDLQGYKINPDVEILLIRTGFEKFRTTDTYWNNNPGINPELADYLRSEFPSLRCIGFDFISLTSWKYRAAGRLAHKKFLAPKNGRQPILVIEDMSLQEIQNDISWLLVSPVLIENGNGGPVTVFANQKG